MTDRRNGSSARAKDASSCEDKPWGSKVLRCATPYAVRTIFQRIGCIRSGDRLESMADGNHQPHKSTSKN